MKSTDRMRLSRILALFLSAVTLLVAALLITQCADIYRIGTSDANRTASGVFIHDVYSREIVATYFGRMVWAVWLWLAAFLAALVFRVPEEREVLRPPVECQLALLLPRVEKTADMAAEERKRRSVGIVCGGVCLLCAVFAGIYLLNRSHFSSRDLEAVMGQMLLHVAPWVAVAFAGLAACAQFRQHSLERELALAKAAPRRQPDAAEAKPQTAVLVSRIVLAAAALALIIAGIQNGGMYDVLVKAINICTECIGLG